MKNRDQKITFRVTISIEQMAAESGRSMEKYCRAMLTKPKAKTQPKPKPPAEVPKLLAVSNAMDNSINEIRYAVHAEDTALIEAIDNLKVLHLEIRRLIKEL